MHKTVSDDQLIETVEALYVADETAPGKGGVLAATIADEVPLARKTVLNRLRALSEAGEIDHAWALNPRPGKGNPVMTFLPAGTLDALSREVFP